MTRIAAQRFTGGALKADRTLRKMRAQIRGALRDPVLWETARGIVAGVPERDQTAQALAVRAWVLARYKYVNDPVSVELIETPGYLLAQIRDKGTVMGDCDAGASLTAALCMAVGIACELWAVGFSKEGGFQHVFAVAFPRRGPAVELDVSRPSAVNMPRRFARRLRLRV